MRMLLSVAVALAVATPAFAQTVSDPDAPVALYAKQKPAPAQASARADVRGTFPFTSFLESMMPQMPRNRFGSSIRGESPAPRGQVGASAAPWDASLDAQIARHAAANGVPMALARRVVTRESRGNPRAVSKGNYGLMQIRLGTARAMGYRGNAQGLLDADTNMTYAMRYLAGALRAARGDHDRAVRLYARGYYPEAKAMGFSPYAPPRTASLGSLGLTGRN